MLTEQIVVGPTCGERSSVAWFTVLYYIEYRPFSLQLAECSLSRVFKCEKYQTHKPTAGIRNTWRHLMLNQQFSLMLEFTNILNVRIFPLNASELPRSSTKSLKNSESQYRLRLNLSKFIVLQPCIFCTMERFTFLN